MMSVYMDSMVSPEIYETCRKFLKRNWENQTCPLTLLLLSISDAVTKMTWTQKGYRERILCPYKDTLTLRDENITPVNSKVIFWCVALKILHLLGAGNGTLLQYSCLENPMDGGAWQAAVHGVAKSQTRLSDFTFTFHFHALEKEMATNPSVLAWRIPGMGEPGGLPSMGSHRVGHDWSDLAAAAAAAAAAGKPESLWKAKQRVTCTQNKDDCQQKVVPSGRGPLGCKNTIGENQRCCLGSHIIDPASFCCCSVAKSCRTLRPYGLQHTRLPCPPPSSGVCSNSCPLSLWCYPPISVALFSSCPQSFPASGSFPVSQLFSSGSQSIGASASASVFPVNIQGWFPSTVLLFWDLYFFGNCSPRITVIGSLLITIANMDLMLTMSCKLFWELCLY